MEANIIDAELTDLDQKIDHRFLFFNLNNKNIIIIMTIINEIYNKLSEYNLLYDINSYIIAQFK